MKQLRTIWLVAVVLIGYCCCPVFAATYTVNPGESIQTAINAASYGDTVEVAAGTYAERITLKNGVALLGAGETDTTIDGNNSGIVVSSNGCDSNTVLDGFTITGGNAADYGGGMYNENGSPTVTNCMFTGNLADCYGGGMYNENGSPMVTNCSFTGNVAAGNYSWGGGMYNNNGSPTVTNCTFSGNIAIGEWSVGCGGGMYSGGGSPMVTNCSFRENIAAGGGGE